VATLAHDLPDVPRPLAWFREFLKHELAPYPGRAVIVTRMVLAATLVMIVCNTFRIPYAFLGTIFALLISRESPRATLSSAGMILAVAGTGALYLLASVQFVISVPPLHFVWIIASLFLAFFVLAVASNYGASLGFALLISVGITIWDRHVSAETNVEATLDLLLVALVAVVVTSGVELALQRVRPGDDVVLPVTDRLAAIHSALTCYSEGRPVDPATEEKLVRLGMLGTSAMRRALHQSDYSPQYRAQMGGVVALAGSLVDITTALIQLRFEPSSFDQRH
jgi:multidrug resistance protein MdtO